MKTISLGMDSHVAPSLIAGKHQRHNKEVANLEPSGVTNRKSLWMTEPYWLLIESRQYHKCILLYQQNVNCLRLSLNGRKLSYNQCRKRLQDFLANHAQWADNNADFSGTK